MERQVLFAGFGGQGVLSMGHFLSHVAMHSGKEVAFVPSYGAEMRGGTANCLVTISDEEISSPVSDNPMMAVIMNRPSLDKFEGRIKPQGTLLINSSLVDRKPVRDDLRIYEIEVNKLLETLDNERAGNMVLLGAYIEKTGIVDINRALEHFTQVFSGKSEEFIKSNRKAFLAGIEYARCNW